MQPPECTSSDEKDCARCTTPFPMNIGDQCCAMCSSGNYRKQCLRAAVIGKKYCLQHLKSCRMDIDHYHAIQDTAFSSLLLPIEDVIPLVKHDDTKSFDFKNPFFVKYVIHRLFIPSQIILDNTTVSFWRTAISLLSFCDRLRTEHFEACYAIGSKCRSHAIESNQKHLAWQSLLSRIVPLLQHFIVNRSQWNSYLQQELFLIQKSKHEAELKAAAATKEQQKNSLQQKTQTNDLNRRIQRNEEELQNIRKKIAINTKLEKAQQVIIQQSKQLLQLHQTFHDTINTAAQKQLLKRI